MVGIDGQQQDLVLFNAGQSLKEQITSFSHEFPWLFVRLVFSCDPVVINASLTNVGLALIDATEEPAGAMDLLEYVMPRVVPERLAVYTDRVYEGLEVFVRVRGVLLLLGPMEAAEWSGLFQPLQKRPLRVIMPTPTSSPSERPERQKAIPISPSTSRQCGRR